MATIDDGPTRPGLLQSLPPLGRNVEWGCLRLDLIHPTISGNKYFKLKHNLQHALDNNCKSILTFGGAYSNHLHATAAAAREYDLPSIGLVRGTHAAKNLTPTLRDCAALGMKLVFISRESYAQKDDPVFLAQLTREYNDPYIIPEGGANQQGREGASEIAQLIPPDFTHVCVSVGTGTTFIGLRNALPSSQAILGFAPMRGGTYLHTAIHTHLCHDKDHHWQLFDHYHFGGFGKSTEDLISLMNTFYTQTSIPLDVVYTSKMIYGIKELIHNNFFPPASKILAIHTGGLQGNAAIKDKLVY